MYSCRRYLDPPQFPRDILTGVDRAQTVFLTRPGACADQYQQPVELDLVLTHGPESRQIAPHHQPLRGKPATAAHPILDRGILAPVRPLF